MRIHYMSDLHLEFGALEKPLPKGEVVILAGDTTLLATLDPDRTDRNARRVRAATLEFFDAVGKSFDRIIYLMGNHEHYGYCIDDTEAAIRRNFPNVTLLENGQIDLGEVIVIGATLWTGMGHGDPLVELTLQRGMSDFYIIEKRDGERKRTFRPGDARELHRTSLAYIEKAVEENSNRRLVVATHHAPSLQGVAPLQRTSQLNAAYYTDLHAFIEARPNVGFWVHGHTHVQTEYAIGGCRVLSNARGYAGREQAAAVFEPDRWFEV
jgi:hypothetical protein